MSEHITKRINLPNAAGMVVLYDWMAAEAQEGQNLVLLNAEGNLVWTAKPPEGNPDCFTDVAWDGHLLTAHRWSCYLVSISLDDGGLTVLAFTK